MGHAYNTATPNPPQLPEPTPPELLRILALVDSWQLCRAAENHSPGTIGKDAANFDLFLRWLYLHGKPTTPEAIDKSVIREWIAESLATRADSTTRTRWGSLRSFFKWAYAEDEIAVNPMEHITAPTVGHKVIPLVADVDLKAILKVCDGPLLVDRRDEALFLMYADTGARLSEIAGIRLDEIDLRERVAKIHGKGNRERWIPFGARTAKAIDRYMRVRARTPYAHVPALWLSGKDFRPMTPDAVKQMFRRRAAQAGIEGAFHPHMLRHSFADKWLESGGSETGLMDIAGWRSREMVGRYGAVRRAARAKSEYQERSPMDRFL